MSQTSKSKSKVKKFFNIDKEARKHYPDSNVPAYKRMTPLPIYCGVRLNRFEVRYRQMPS